MYALSCHAPIADQQTSESSSILRSLEAMLSEKYRIGHSTIQFECHAHQDRYCPVDGLYCQMDAAGHEHSHALEEEEQEAQPEGRLMAQPITQVGEEGKR